MVKELRLRENWKVSLLLKLCLCYLVLLTWMKAGLVDGFPRAILFGLSFVILCLHFGKRSSWRIAKLLPLAPLLFLTALFLSSLLNPAYRVLTVKDLNALGFREKLLQSGNAEKIELLSNGLNGVINRSLSDPSGSLVLFFHLHQRYQDKFGKSGKDEIGEFLSQCKERIFIKKYPFLPSIPILDPKIAADFYWLVFSLMLGVLLFQENGKPDSNIKLLAVFLVNSVLLSLVGFVQMHHHANSDDYKEILLLWDAPEPRYYFSTFTYKNHWSAFALLGLFTCFFFLARNVSRDWGNLKRSPAFFCLLLCALVLASSILFSGSRSGSVLLFLSVLAFLLFLGKGIYRFRILDLHPVAFAATALPALALVGLVFFQSQTYKEMFTNTNSQLKEIQKGNPPMRWLLMRDAWKKGRENLWLGNGFGSYACTSPLYQSKQVRDARAIGLEHAHNPYVPLVAHAHSDLMEWVIEWGLAGLFLGIIPYFFFIFKIAGFNGLSPSMMLLAGIAVFLIYCIVDFPTRTPACTASFAALCAAGIREAIRSKKTHPSD